MDSSGTVKSFMVASLFCFAAQIVYATGRNAPAPKASGWPRAKPEPRSDRKSPRPPIFRLPPTDSFLSFQFFGFENLFCPLLLVRHKSCGMNDCPIQTRLGISSGNSPDPIQLFEQMQTLVYRQVEAESLILLLERCHFHSRPIHVPSLSAFQAPLHRRCPLDVLTPAC